MARETETAKGVLVVEDDGEMRETLREVLEDGGYAVSVVGNGQAALDHLARVMKSGAPPSVILVDLMMPVMDGWQFCEKRLEEPSIANIPVIIMSASASQPPRGVEFIRKPFDLDALLTLVGRLAN